MCDSIIALCKTCGKSFHPSKYKASKFCSVPCYRVAQRAGDYATWQKQTGVCGHCSAPVFGRSKSVRRNGVECENIYCSTSCYRLAEKLTAESRRTECKHCNQSFVRNWQYGKAPTYCSMACRVAHSKPITCRCLSCKVEFSAISTRSDGKRWYVRVNGRKTCSKECLSEFYKSNQPRKDKISAAFSESKHPNWQGGTHRQGNRGAGWNATAEKCRDLHRRKCKNCGMDESVGLARGWGRLQVNHITPFHQTLNKRAANRQSNLEALCKSCHTKADWKWRKENSVQMSLDIFTGH